MRELHNFSLSIGLWFLFFLSWLGQGLAHWQEFKSDQEARERRQPRLRSSRRTKGPFSPPPSKPVNRNSRGERPLGGKMTPPVHPVRLSP
jgi:hypothetical protein